MNLTDKFGRLPKRTRDRVVKQAYKDVSSQYVVRKGDRLISVPQYNVRETLRRLGIKIEAEVILLK